MGKKTKNILKAAGWVLLTPICLVLLLFVALYIPPVQKWAVDLAADYLSSETGMQVSVGSVRLKFPLDLSMGDVLITRSAGVQEYRSTNDTILDAKELLASVQAMPLLKGEVKIDYVTLTNTKVNTLDLIESMQLKYQGESLKVKDVNWNMNNGRCIVSDLNLQTSDISILMADSVPEDTTTEEESMLKWVDLQHVSIQNLSLTLSQGEGIEKAVDKTSPLEGYERGVSINTYIGKANTSVRLDLENGNYYVAPLKAQDFEYQMGNGQTTDLSLQATALSIDSLSYLSTGDLYVDYDLNSSRFTFNSSPIDIDSLSGVFRMDSTTLYVDDTRLKTPNSDLKVDMQMDMNAFDTGPTAGTMRIDAEGVVSKKDIMPFAADLPKEIDGKLPDRPITLAISAEGNMQHMDISRLNAHMNGVFDINGRGGMENGRLKIEESRLSYGRSKAIVKGSYDMESETYDIDINAQNLYVNDFVALSDPCHLSGHLRAKGRGFDFTSRSTYTNATLDLKHVDYGTYYLDNTHMTASLKNNIIAANTHFGDERLDGQLAVEGTMNKKGVEATMALDLPFSDLQALGLSADPLTAHATHGDFKVNSNYKELFLADAAVEGVEIVLKGDSLVTEKFDLHAETTQDTTTIQLTTSDMDFDFRSPKNLFAVIDDFTKVAQTAQQQMENRDLNINLLKEMMPETTLRANIGNKNPISKYLFMQGFRYEEVAANLRTSTEYGLQGNAHVYNLITDDSLRIDTVQFDLYQDSTQISYNVAVSCPDQDVCSAFTAYLDGYVSPQYVDSRLTYFNVEKEKGIDLGVRGLITTDSLLHLSLYPKQPIIAYRTFEVNDDNYIDLYRQNKLKANILMLSTSDSCSISIYANPVDSQMQNIEAVIKNLNIAELLTVIPFAPQMAGLLNVSANYVQTSEGFTINGMTEADRFTYEGTGLGNLMTMFNYQPMGDHGHDINAMIYHNDEHIGILKGNYDVTGEDHLNATLILDHLPLATVNAFIADNIFALDGTMNGMVSVTGHVDSLLFNGQLNPEGVHVYSDIYSFNLAVADEPITFDKSHLTFNDIKIMGAGQNPLTVNGFVDFADLNNIAMNLSLYGQNFLVFDAPRTRRSALFGKLYGDFFARVNGTTNDLKIRGLVNVLSATDITYIMTNTPLAVDDRLDDIVTFVDFSAPPDEAKRVPRTFTGIDMQINLEIEDGVQVRCEFSADKQSYVNVQGNGSLTMTYSPEGVINMLGKYTVNEGEMKYTLPIIPLKTFTLQKGSYIEFTGKPGNPTMNITATEQTKASVSNLDGSSRSVLFNVGLKVFNTLENMGLEFTIDAPEDLTIQNELAGMTTEEKNKLAVALLATGMYLSTSNESGFSTTNALNNFLQEEINNIAGKAISSAVNVDMSVGMELTKRDDGTTRTDYSFKFSKRFFSDRLNVVVGGRINADGNSNRRESGAYIDDISLEWRLDKGGTQYIRIFHDKNYDNLVEGELTENGAGIVLRKKFDNLSELFIWKKKKKDDEDKE